MRKYQFVVGVSLAALEEEVNRLVNDEPALRLIQVLYAVGSGFVAIMERSAASGEPRQEPVAVPVATGKSPKKPPKK
jgi:hypothetical protein